MFIPFSFFAQHVNPLNSFFGEFTIVSVLEEDRNLSVAEEDKNARRKRERLSFLFWILFYLFFYMAGSYQLSLLYILVYICQSQSPNPSPQHPRPATFPPWCPYVCWERLIWRNWLTWHWGLWRVLILQVSRLETQGRVDIAVWVRRPSGGRVPYFSGDFSLFLLRLSTDCMGPIHIMEGHLLYSESTDVNVNHI